MAQTALFIRDPVGALPHYPLWDMNPANLRPDVAVAVAEGEHLDLRVRLLSVLRVVRFPYE